MSLKENLEKEFETQVSDLVKTNLMVVGGTGVGKSSLINKVFGKDLAKTGAGQPITRGCDKYESRDVPVVIYDTEGYEIINGELNNSNFESRIISEIER